MRKLLTSLAIFFAINSIVLAQQLPTKVASSDSTQYEYCQLLVEPKGNINKNEFTVEVNYNEEINYITDSDGKPYIFKGVAKALNLMGENGWKLESTNMLQTGFLIIYYTFSRSRI